MKKKVLFFTQDPPEDKTAIHIWVGKAAASHEEHLREILGRYLGSSSFQLETLPGGKLFLPDKSLHFNLSDSQEWLAVALSWEAPVGIDIEIIRPLEGMEQLISDCFSPNEQAYVYRAQDGFLNPGSARQRKIDPNERDHCTPCKEGRFYEAAASPNSQNPTERGIAHKERLVRFWEIWNRKEACFKALGLGLQDNISEWDCSGEDWILVNRVWVRSVPMEHSLSAAVAIQERVSETI